MFKYCVIGNIVKEHPDPTGITRYGTAAFPGGRRVYISRRLWDDKVVVMGLNRHKARYAWEMVPVDWIENIRVSKTFNLRMMEVMTNTSEYPDMWWRYKDEDKKGALEFAQILNRVKAGDREVLARYSRDVMSRFY